MAWKFFAQDGNEKITAGVQSSVGFITPFAGPSAPTGWMLCQGQQIAQALYPELAQKLGRTYGDFTDGSGNSGTTHFRLPDFRGRAPVGFKGGKGDNGFGTGTVAGGVIASITHGESLGAESVTLSANESGVPYHNHNLTGSHTHTVNNTSHSHTVYYGSQAAILSGVQLKYPDGANTSTVASESISIGASMLSNTTNISLASHPGTAAASSHDNMQPFIVVNYIIRVIP